MADDAHGSSRIAVSPKIAMGVAIGVMGFFGVVVIALLEIAGRSSDTTWTRLVYVYAGVEAIAFGAAGLLFGTSIQRSQTVAAENREEASRAQAEDASAQAETARGELADVTEKLIAGADLVAGARALKSAIRVQREAVDRRSRASPGAPEARGAAGQRQVQATPGQSGAARRDLGSSTDEAIIQLDELASRLLGND